MKAFQITDYRKIVIAEKVEDVKMQEWGEIEEVCDVEPGCYLGSEKYFLKGEDEPTYGDYVCEGGRVIGAEDHTGEGKTMGYIDVEKTNELCRENGNMDFRDWDFDLWVGSYWNGSNWRVVAVDR